MRNLLKAAAANMLAVGAVPLSWDRSTNFGDRLNPLLVEMLSSRRVSRMPYGLGPSYFVIGSILHKADRRNTIWGAGFMFPDGCCSEPPARVLAVRGPLTAERLRNSGVHCPDVFGDPAILLPRLIAPRIRKSHRLGIIPHYADKNVSILGEYADQQGVKIIDVQAEAGTFIEDVLSCECIASSSLHGLVVAEAYGIPSTHLILGDRVLGGRFKFRDYRLGLAAPEHHPIEIMDRRVPVAEIVERATVFPVENAQSALLASCPFYKAA